MKPETAKVLSIQQPWVTIILYPQVFTSHGLVPKRIENRSKDITHGYRGQVFLHTGLNPSGDFYNDATGRFEHAPGRISNLFPHDYEKWMNFTCANFGGIVGCAQIVDVVTQSTSPWYREGQYGIILENPQPLPFYKCPGKPWLFDIPVAPIFEHASTHCCCCSLKECFCTLTSCPGCGNCTMDCMCPIFR